jgi:hypothetical protein
MIGKSMNLSGLINICKASSGDKSTPSLVDVLLVLAMISVVVEEDASSAALSTPSITQMFKEIKKCNPWVWDLQ